MESKIRVYSGSLCFQFYINDRERPSDIKVTRDRKERKGKRGWRRGGEEREREKKGKTGERGGVRGKAFKNTNARFNESKNHPPRVYKT